MSHDPTMACITMHLRGGQLRRDEIAVTGGLHVRSLIEASAEWFSFHRRISPGCAQTTSAITMLGSKRTSGKVVVSVDRSPTRA